MKKLVLIALAVMAMPYTYAQKDTTTKVVNINEVVISAQPKQDGMIINKIDRALRPVNSAQDLLTLVPGLFIAQHAGGGKAEQIFYRGFDHDHGTDFAISVDGLPVNMVSHAHGQGYADFHFVIPELVQDLKLFAGPYSAKFGDFATSGAAAFSTKNNIGGTQAKVEAGMFDTYRALVMVDLLGQKHLFSKQKEDAYIAGEYVFTNAYFKSPQAFNRSNFVGKYHGLLSNKTTLSLLASSFSGKWNASGQIPNRAVENGSIDRFGSIDNTEGGQTARKNAYATITNAVGSTGLIKNQVFYTRYNFNLYSNFTFFLQDSINGDGIRQNDQRNIFGYNGSYENAINVGKNILKSVYGLQARIDKSDLILDRHRQRVSLKDTLVAGVVNQKNYSAYTEQTLILSNKIFITGGVRFDNFDFGFQHYKADSLSGRVSKSVLSPKGSIIYDLSANFQLFLKGGYGFHSNDARDVVIAVQKGRILPKALGYEIGSVFKLSKKAIINVALYALDLQSELVYVGDAGEVEAKSASHREGIDVSVRYQMAKNLYIDLDVNANKGRFIDLPYGENAIPLAPKFTSIGGLSYRKDKGLNASLRYKYIADRPANEANTVRALGYYLMDALAQYNFTRTTLGISAENLLNVKWNQAQFDTESRLKNETSAVSELHFTPGTPFFVKASVAYRF